MATITMITSGKDGVGKSTVSALTAEALALRGKSVLVIEFENGLGSSRFYLRASDTIWDMSDVFAGLCSLDDALATSEVSDKIHILCSSLEKSLPDLSQFETLVLALSDHFDHILIDTDSRNETIASASRLAMNNIIVSPCSQIGIRDSSYVSELLHQNNCPNIRLVINRLIPVFVHQEKELTIDRCIDSIGAQLIAVIPELQEVFHATEAGTPLPPRTLGHKVFDALAQRLDGTDVPLVIL